MLFVVRRVWVSHNIHIIGAHRFLRWGNGHCCALVVDQICHDRPRVLAVDLPDVIHAARVAE